MRVPVHFLIKILSRLTFHCIKYIFEVGTHQNEILVATSCNEISWTSTVAYRMLQAVSHRCSSKPGLGGVMVSTAACTQVVQGSNPTDGWKVTWNTTAFFRCGI